MLTEEDDQLVEFGIGGLCNLCLGEFEFSAYSVFRTIHACSCQVQNVTSSNSQCDLKPHVICASNSVGFIVIPSWLTYISYLVC